MRRGLPFPKSYGIFNPSLLYGEGDILKIEYVRIDVGIEDGNNYDGKSHLIAEIRDENGIVGIRAKSSWSSPLFPMSGILERTVTSYMHRLFVILGESTNVASAVKQIQ